MNTWYAVEKELNAVCPKMKVRQKVPMGECTSFRVGGTAALMIFPKTEEEASSALKTVHRLDIAPFFLGNGSNLLVSDDGYDGVVLKYSEKLLPHLENGAFVSGAANFLGILSVSAAKSGLSGLEFAYGIPGFLGGAITMNAGAYGGEMAQVVSWVKVVNEEGEIERISAENCDFAYRHSTFFDGKQLILEAGFALQPGDPKEIAAKMSDLAAQRKTKQPLEYPSAGSTFKRPAPLSDGTPVYAAALIDQCGLKGLTVGGAQVSEKHAGFIINRGGATCADILALIREVQKRVLDQTGVALEPEVKMLGV